MVSSLDERRQQNNFLWSSGSESEWGSEATSLLMAFTVFWLQQVEKFPLLLQVLQCLLNAGSCPCCVCVAEHTLLNF